MIDAYGEMAKNTISNLTRKWLITTTALLGLLLLTSNIQAQTTNIPSGSLIIDMGVTPQTIENGLKPYGLAYELINIRKTPVIWTINQSKVKDGTDFIVDGRQFKGGPFIILEQYLGDSGVQTSIATWQAKGVVTYTTLTDVFVEVYRELTVWPQWVLDTDNGNIAQTYLDLAEIPSSAYRYDLPSNLGSCDDLFILPHADPNWTDHGNLYTWTDSFANGGSQGWIWSGCHGVSALEDLYNPLDPSQQLNFLANKTVTATNNGSDYFENALILWGNHNDASGIYPYNNDFPTDAYMQFMGNSDGAHEGGSEQIYLPLSGGSWRTSTKVAAWDTNQSDLLSGNTPGKAAFIAYGPAFGDTNRGMVMYEGGHRLDNGTEAENVAAIRTFLNFSFDAPTARAPQMIDNTVIPVIVEGGETITFDVDVVAASGGSYNFTWTSTCTNGSFSGTTSTADNTTTTFSTTSVVSPEQCIITLRVVDPSCGKESFKSYGLTIIPPPAPPIANDDDYTTYSSNSITFNPLANDTDPNFNIDPSSLSPTSALVIPGEGQFIVNLNNTISFFPDSSFVGTTTLSYTICDDTPLVDGGPFCDSATISIAVLASPCAVNEIVVGTTGYGASVVSSTDWKNPNKALGAPDSDFSKADKNNGFIIIDLGGNAIIGSQITFRVFSDKGNSVTGTVDAATTSTGFPNNPISVTTSTKDPSVDLITFDVVETGILYIKVSGVKEFGLESVVFEKETCVPALVATNDDFTTTPINGQTGGVAGDATLNDIHGGVAVVDPDISIYLIDDGGLTGVSMDSNGNIIVPASSMGGAYTITYIICDNTYPTNCGTATASLLVKIYRVITNRKITYRIKKT